MMARRKNTHSERGMAMVLTMIMLVVVLGAVLLVSSQAMYAKKQTDMAQNQYQLEEACKAGIDYTIQRIWNQYLAGNGNEAGSWLTYRTFITNIVAKINGGASSRSCTSNCWHSYKRPEDACCGLQRWIDASKNA